LIKERFQMPCIGFEFKKIGWVELTNAKEAWLGAPHGVQGRDCKRRHSAFPLGNFRRVTIVTNDINRMVYYLENVTKG
jgi:hypothetical protein